MVKIKDRPQVFINFRGEDERQKLLPHLKHHLKENNVNVFTDDDAIGEPLKNLFKHIRRSRIVIVIFSVNYLESKWCLDELVEIRKRLKTEKLDFAIPIFYKVKTSHVKEQTGKFGTMFVALQQKHRSSRIQKWKKALRYVAKYIGVTYQKRSSISELDFIKKIVEMVNLTLTKISSKDNDNNNNNSPETSWGETSNITDVNKMLTLDTREEISYRQGFMVGSAWKDGIISSMPSRSHNWGVDSRHIMSPHFGHLVPPRYSPWEPNVPQAYGTTFSYGDNIYQYPPRAHAMGVIRNPVRPSRQSLRQYLTSWPGVVGSCLGSAIPYEKSEDILSSEYNRIMWGLGSPSHAGDVVTSSDFDQYPIIDPTSMHDNTVSISHAAEAEDVTSIISLDLDQCPTIDSRNMHDDIVTTSHAGEREDKKSCISFLCSWFKRCFSLKWGNKRR